MEKSQSQAVGLGLVAVGIILILITVTEDVETIEECEGAIPTESHARWCEQDKKSYRNIQIFVVVVGFGLILGGMRTLRLTEKEAEKKRQRNHELQLKRKENELKEATIYFQKGGLTNLRKALKIYTYQGYPPTSKQIRKIKIAIAKEKEVHLDYAGALSIFEELGLHKDAKRIRQKMRDEGRVKVDQTVVHGDYVDDRDTIIKDSVISKSNVGSSGDDKFARLERLTEMKEKGLIDDAEFKQMKKEILG